MHQTIRTAIIESRDGFDTLLQDEIALGRIENAGRLLAGTFAGGGRVFSCGNGGSLCDAMHFAEECSGRFRKNRDPLPATAISDVSHITCTANDYGWDQVFSRYIAAHGRAGDLLLALSTSGKSENVLAAAREAKSRGMKVVALTGKRGSELGALADLEIAAPGAAPASGYSDHVQELHIAIIHILVQLTERILFPGLY
jgi:D-sedoheptulose 7-phosphate isomerase